MIKLVHTADWHAGKTNAGESRRDDLIYALDQLKDFVKREKVDCLLVCGDIFDKVNVSPQDMMVVWSFFFSIREYGTKSVVITGNHDPKEFLGTLKKFLHLIDVHVFDKVQPRTQDAFLNLKLGRDKEENINFFAFPYLNPNIPTDIIKNFGSDAAGVEGYMDFVGKYLSNALNYLSPPCVMLSHIAVEGAKLSGTEKEISVKPDFRIHHSAIPSQFIYCALGHIHGRQEISDTKRIYYSGTLYQIDFGEENDTEKGFYFLTIKDGKIDKEPEFIRISIKRKMKTYTFDLAKQRIESIVSELERDKGTLKRIFLKSDEDRRFMVPEYISKIKAVEGVLYVVFEEKRDESKAPDEADLGSMDIPDLLTLYEKFFIEVKKGEPELFHQSIRPKIAELIEEYNRRAEADAKL